jgi:uncharacterized RDD family membrane protein YckC
MTLAHERTSEFFEKRRRQRRDITTPEGVTIPVTLADYGERLTAFAIDLAIWVITLIVLFVPLLSVAGISGSGVVALSIWLFIFFVIRNLYFAYFEIAWRGATPGKRAVGIRVIDRAGGPLLPSAVIARNFTREVEMFVPLGVLITGSRGVGGGVDWSHLSIAVWLLVFAALPLINRDRMRGGDLIAGTIVVSLPSLVLLSDLVEETMEFSFTEQQLGAYGAFELQVLEELLRRPSTPDGMRVLEEVCSKICHRIGWTEPISQNQVLAFLRDFYTAERAFLERAQLYGKGRADKFAQRDRSA